MYFTTAGPKSGPILWRHDLDAIDISLSPADGPTIGSATPVGATDGGIAIWVLHAHGSGLPGRWIVLGREFRLKR